MSRKDLRHEFAELLKIELGDLVSAVYSGQVADFAKARSVVVISSAGSVPRIVGAGNYQGVHQVAVDIFVLYADAETDWDEEDAEDLLDEINQKVMDTLEKHPTGKNWTALDWTDPSQTMPIVDLGGTEYRREQIILQPS
jgi:hypothetical protein